MMPMVTRVATKLLDGRQTRRAHPEDVMRPALKFSGRFSMGSPGGWARYRFSPQYSWNTIFTVRFFIWMAGKAADWSLKTAGGSLQINFLWSSGQ
jgi:hypothetical protein